VLQGTTPVAGFTGAGDPIVSDLDHLITPSRFAIEEQLERRRAMAAAMAAPPPRAEERKQTAPEPGVRHDKPTPPALPAEEMEDRAELWRWSILAAAAGVIKPTDLPTVA
jgi:hypothetical protein